MAGAFGHEADHAKVSDVLAERVLAPAVRTAPEQTLILTNGSSCREQIRHKGDRTPLHAAEVLKKAIEGSRQTGKA